VAVRLVEVCLLQQLLALFLIQAYILMQMIREDVKKYLKDRFRVETTVITAVCLHCYAFLYSYRYRMILMMDDGCRSSVMLPSP
jgi:hypothetical protein